MNVPSRSGFSVRAIECFFTLMAMLFQLNEGFCLVNEQQKVQISLLIRRGASSANLKEKSRAKTETHELSRPPRSFTVLAKQIFAN